MAYGVRVLNKRVFKIKKLKIIENNVRSKINKENKTRLLKFISSDLIDDIYNLSNGIRKRSKDFLVEILNRIN